MVNTRSQMDRQQQEPYDDTYQERQPSYKSHRSRK